MNGPAFDASDGEPRLEEGAWFLARPGSAAPET